MGKFGVFFGVVIVTFKCPEGVAIDGEVETFILLSYLCS